MKNIVNVILRHYGLHITKIKQPIPYYMRHDNFEKIHDLSRPFTGTNTECLYNMFRAIQYVVKNNIKGAIMECGVSQGGMMMSAAAALSSMRIIDRELWLYDTYTGMAKPTERDKYIKGKKPVMGKWESLDRGTHNAWNATPLEQVKERMESTGYPKEKMVFVKGRVEDTIPGQIPDHIAILRLDSDWYESTKHEMRHLFPRLVKGGVLIIDDYGTFQGARDVVNEYVAEHGISILLINSDKHGSVTGIKYVELD